VALRPRLSPGLPFSRILVCEDATIGAGTAGVNSVPSAERIRGNRGPRALVRLRDAPSLERDTSHLFLGTWEPEMRSNATRDDKALARLGRVLLRRQVSW
jgi:hypothetical protein